MLRYLVRRLFWAIPVLIVATILVFAAVRMTTDPVAAAARNPRTTPEALAKYKHDLGLDRGPIQQYWAWIKGFAHGDLGNSLFTQGPVWPDLRSALANTLVLGGLAWMITVIVGVSIGIGSALRQYSWFDNFSTGFAFIGLSLPPFVFGLLLQVLVGTYYEHWFGKNVPLLPLAGLYSPGRAGFDFVDRFRHLLLPAMVVAVQGIAVYSRYMRASMLEQLNSDYLRTARAKGISERRVIVRHALRNALIPLTTYAAIDIGAIAGGLIITEQIFQYPGMGVYFLNAFHNGDYMQILPSMMIVAISVVGFNLLADVACGWLDPRIRLD
jgi:peptide/nickel transport system permease protein